MAKFRHLLKTLAQCDLANTLLEHRYFSLEFEVLALFGWVFCVVLLLNSTTLFWVEVWGPA